MESNKILQADILDILFDGRNKEYGAYDLRKTYNMRLTKAIAVTGSVIVLLFVGGMVMGHGAKHAAPPPVPTEIVLAAAEQPREQLPPPPPPPPRAPEPVAMRAFTPPRIVPEDQVKPEDAPPPQDDLNDVKIGAANVAGKGDDGTVSVPSGPTDGGKGLVEEKKEPEPEIWTKVEIESTYPGGNPAWQRFMNKNFHYPDDAQNNEIQGTVIVQFIVDEQGNVSNVQAVSGPETGGLREEAVRVIKKSGLWTPAIQNGRQVKSYKRQPITFKINE